MWSRHESNAEIIDFVENAVIHFFCASDKCRFSSFVNWFSIYLCIYAGEKTGSLSPMGPVKSRKWNWKHLNSIYECYMESLRQTKRLTFFDCQPSTESYCQAKFDYLKDCISPHKLPREIPKELFEEDASHRVCDEYIEDRRCNIFLLERNGFWH